MLNSKLQFKIKPYLILIFLILLFPAGQVFAAELFVDSKSQEIKVGEQIEMSIFLNTENEYINAVEGRIVFPKNLLVLKEIRDGNSIINFWIEKPKTESNNQIIFSGIIPGGYISKKGLIFSAIFQSKNEGEGIIEIHEAKTLLNDGEGTPAKLSITNFQFLISEQVPISQIPIAEIKDSEPPEDFKPEIASNPNIFDGKWFLVFATQDKGSGIDHYEILEKSQRGSLQGLVKKEGWQIGESPYLLKDQKLKSYIYVKAIDKAGNERIATLEPKYPLKWYEKWRVWGIILLGVIVISAIWRILWIKRHAKIR